jgi:hypothetical protein
VDALAAQHLVLTTDATSGAAAGTSQLVCRFQGTGTGADTAIIVVATAYPDAATAIREDQILRATVQAQGGKFTSLDGVGDEAYSFAYPTVTGVAERRGSDSVSIGVGKLLGVPKTEEYSPVLQTLLSKLGG